MASWWTYERICATVTPEYVIRAVGIQRQRTLYEPLKHGTSSNDLTYLGWITLRCKRLFLVLNGLECPEHIFTAVDNGLEDADLPMTGEEAECLEFLDAALTKRFVRLQYTFIVQELEEGTHVRYVEQDIVPVDSLPRPKSIPTHLEKVRVKDQILWRRRIALKENGIEKVHFELHFKLLMQRIRHEHLTSVWATYIQGDTGFILLRPSCDVTLEAFLDNPPKSFRQLPTARQREIVVHWLQCLTTALAFLHVNNIAHMVIRPSNIFINEQFHIYLGAHSMLGGLEDSKKPAAYNKESYRYGAPEHWSKQPRYTDSDPLRTVLQTGGRTRRRVKPHDLPLRTEARSPPPPYPPSLQHSQLPPRARVGMDGYDAESYWCQTLLNTPVPLPPARPPALVSTMNYYPPNLERSKFDPTPYFPSDVFTLNVILLELLSLLTVTVTSTTNLAPTKVPEFLGRLRQQAGRGGAVPDRSYHANLNQADAWLTKLETAVGPSGGRRRLSLSRRHSGKVSDDDGELWRWRGVALDCIQLVRHGLQRDPGLRWAAPAGAAVVTSVLRKWQIGPPPCCAATPLPTTWPGTPPPLLEDGADSDPVLTPATPRTMHSGPPVFPGTPSTLTADRTGLDFGPELDRASLASRGSLMSAATEVVVPDLGRLELNAATHADAPPPEAVVAVQPPKRSAV